MNPYLSEFDINKNIEEQILDYKRHIRYYQKSLNDEGIWLFLATLGCWGVPDSQMQKVAFIITIVIFFYRFYLQIEDKRTFKQIANDIEDDVKSSTLLEDIKKARLYDLSKIKSKELSLINTIKTMSIFIVCFFFAFISMGISKSI
ncbi:MAG TPA: hypothetical protein VGD04_02890 [Methylophilus sp.]